MNMNKKRSVLLVLMMLLLVLSLGKSAGEGCYYYPDSDLYCTDVLESAAAADYKDYADYFNPGASCTGWEMCDIITCSKGCEDMTRGECDELQGIEITQEMSNEWCSGGCCRIAGVYCNYINNKQECLDRAIAVKGPTGLPDIWNFNVERTECTQNICLVDLTPGKVSGIVREAETEKPVEGAIMELQGIGTVDTTADGTYKFENLNAISYVMRVSADGFISQSKLISLSVGEELELNFLLEKGEGVGVLTGIVSDVDGGMGDVVISWNGPTQGFILSEEDGSFLVEGLPAGTYDFTARKPSYATATKKFTFTDSGEQTWNVQLTEQLSQGIYGTVKIKDRDVETRVGGARIYVDGLPRGSSVFEALGDLGSYSINLEEGSHILTATYYGYELEEEVEFELGAGQRKKIELVLIRYIGECSADGASPNKNVNEETFFAEHVLGTEAVELKWEQPCPEVIGYELTRNGEFVGQLSPAQKVFRDDEVTWGETYDYEIIAIYDGSRRSAEPAKVRITLGDERCKDRFDKNYGWEKFCLVEDRQKIHTCNQENQVVDSKPCSGTSYCVQKNKFEAECKIAGSCDLFSQLADPFGLNYDRKKCYGVTSGDLTKDNKDKIQSYCVYDYTNTTANECKSRLEIESCFDYHSKDACDLNMLGPECKWVDVGEDSVIDYSLVFRDLVFTDVTGETGHGYCTEVDYEGNGGDPEGDDYCGLCGPEGEVFENFYCTAEVCSSLGNCFSKADLSGCLTCGSKEALEEGCYAYGTALECGGATDVNSLGKMTLSTDKCSWGRCKWNGPREGIAENGCVKDGDGNNKDDCPTGDVNCKMDNTAPVTDVVSEGSVIISQASPTIIFLGKDDNYLDRVGYCLGSADTGMAKCGGKDFVEEKYPVSSNEEQVERDVNAYLDKEIEGAPYLLRYYSIDQYSNRESVKEEIVYVDNKPPEFEVEWVAETTGALTDVIVTLVGVSEKMSCEFELEPIVAPGESTKIINQTFVPGEDPAVIFNSLGGAIYDLVVSCTDEFGNENDDYEDRLIFDLEERVDIIYPRGPVSELSIVFEVETIRGAVCSLFDTFNGQKITDFVGNEPETNHKTLAIPGFTDGAYEGTHNVICQELLTGEIYKPVFFDFIVDHTDPETEVVMKEGSHVERRTGDEWEVTFSNTVEVDFVCPPSGSDDKGFACSGTYYCLTDEDYVSRGNTCYKKDKGDLVVEESKTLCYYSTDEGKNTAYPNCGKIELDGYGITLVNPEQYYFNDEKWGIINDSTFNWRILTKVPTNECKFDWVEGFGYDFVPASREFVKEANNYYGISGFPEVVGSEYPKNGGVKEVYVKCKNLDGKIGPAQKFYLEYDPTAPKIEKAFAEPDEVLDGINTDVHIETDDKTICKFDEGFKEFGTMRYPLDLEGDVLDIEHIFPYNFNFQGITQQFNMSAQCQNGARITSQIKNFSFNVDYARAGSIVKVEPNGEYLPYTEVTLKVMTNKNAYCLYDGVPFGQTGGLDHVQAVSGLTEKEYIYLIHCQVGEYKREGQIKFTVDLTAPKVEEVSDGNYSCSLSETPLVFVKTNEEAIAGYYYELYQKGNLSGKEVLVTNGSISGKESFKVKADLEENKTYYFKVAAGDKAGWWSELATSGGFEAVKTDAEICVNDDKVPEVVFEIDDSSCTYVEVEMECVDDTSCDIFEYGESYVANTCEALEPYWSQPLLFEETGWICYEVEDRNGNKADNIRKIEFYDEDGDGISDACDLCTETDAGSEVDIDGCGFGETPDSDKKEDTDGDGLPDYWEKMYDDFGCDFNYASIDSDGDGETDDEEDYDGDGYSAYEEYRLGQDPCITDAPPEDRVDPRDGGEDLIDDGSSMAAWILFILGWLLVLSGGGYLVYYHKFMKRPVGPTAVRPRAIQQPERKVTTPWMRKLVGLRMARIGKQKERERSRVFGVFSQDTKKIPHIDTILQKGGDKHRMVAELAKKYVAKKEVIEPGLKANEKGVFTKLEKIAGQTKEKKIEEVVSKNEAKTIFDKLKEISKKRKG